MYVTQSTVLSNYVKVVKVIQSCYTVSQYNGSVKYAKLYLKLLPTSLEMSIRTKLIKVLDTQKNIVKYRYGSKTKLHYQNRSPRSEK